MTIQTRLPLTLLECSGPDIRDFLFRISTASQSALSEAGQAWGAFLDANGKIQSDFYLWALSTEHYLLETATPDTLLEWVERFHFAENFEIRKIAQNPKIDFPVSTISTPQLETNSFLASRSHFKTIWNTHYLFHAETALPLSSENAWNDFRIENALPWAPNEIQNSYNPVELGLSPLLSDKNACYPGQEVVEKIVSKGQPAQRLCRMRWNTSSPTLPDQTTIRIEENVAGVLTTQSPKGALGVLKRRFAILGSEVNVGSLKAVIDWVA